MTMQFLWRFIITQERCTILFSIQCHINCLLVFHKNRQYSSRRLLHSASLPNTTFFPVPNYTPGWREDTYFACPTHKYTPYCIILYYKLYYKIIYIVCMCAVAIGMLYIIHFYLYNTINILCVVCFITLYSTITIIIYCIIPHCISYTIVMFHISPSLCHSYPVAP